MTSIADRTFWLESVARWAHAAMTRREMWESLKQHPDESLEEFSDRAFNCERGVQSAEAMLRGSLKELDRTQGVRPSDE